MKANAVPLLALFEKKMRLEVPLFQRQYVWERESQWEPLWEDIAGKFTEDIEGRRDFPVHFLGAMVFDQKQTPITHVEKRQVIDGQQRLTTLQLFLAALRDFCREQGCEELVKDFEGYTLNRGMMANSDVDKYKVWPTQADREQFKDALGLGSRKAIEEKHPEMRKPRARKPEPRPRMIEAYLFFSDEIRKFFLGNEGSCPIGEEISLGTRIDECFQALKAAIQVVVIDLEQDDDAQVIFETLNARGQPLLPSDLLRNYIFLRAGRTGEPPEHLYETHGRGFEDAFWSVEVRAGRLIRPRSDLFMQHFLASRTMVDVPAKHLFVRYRHWIDTNKPFKTAVAELIALATQREQYRRLVEPQRGDVIYGLAQFLIDFDVGAAAPLLLYLFDVGLSDPDWQSVSTALESYLLRRAVVDLSSQSYTRIFLSLAKVLQQTVATPQAVTAYLSRLKGEGSAWPTDGEFSEAWRTRSAYRQLSTTKLVHILRRVSERFLADKHEKITIDCQLTIEHLLPQQWIEHWPLASGKKGMTDEALEAVNPADPQAQATRERHAALQRMGNLTILTQALNSSVSNAAWARKKPELLKSSLLPINQSPHDYNTWDEQTIVTRGEELLKYALTVWPGPI